jgi:hypothetical protein
VDEVKEFLSAEEYQEMLAQLNDALVALQEDAGR